MVAEENGEGSQVIQMAVSQYHEIEVSIPEERKIGCRLI